MGGFCTSMIFPFIGIACYLHRVYLLAVFSILGILRLKSVTFMVDDVPENTDIKKDLKFFESNFSGIMPCK